MRRLLFPSFKLNEKPSPYHVGLPPEVVAKWQEDELLELAAEMERFAHITYKPEFYEIPFRKDQIQTFSAEHGYSVLSSLPELCEKVLSDTTISEIIFCDENGYRIFKCGTKD